MDCRCLQRNSPPEHWSERRDTIIRSLERRASCNYVFPMTLLAFSLLGVALVLPLYGYIGYPLLLKMIGWWKPPLRQPPPPSDWPLVSISLPAYNEEAQIRGVIESLLALDYPADRLQILVISDASTDRTDEIVREYADRGIELLRMPQRGGKTVAENTAAAHLRGEVVVNTDASIRIRPDALKRLVAHFEDPEIGVASGRDVSVSSNQQDGNSGESGYVGYEMWVRALETRISGIVGASGCFYAIRAHLHRVPLPNWLSRDFGAALIARQHGYRAISVDGAVCHVPRTNSLQREYNRKVRTITRGMETLHHFRGLLNPAQYGVFAWMLFSHKVCRWLVPWSLASGLVGLTLLAWSEPWTLFVLGVAGLTLMTGATGWHLAERRRAPRVFRLVAYALAGNIAALHAGIRAIAGERNPVWEPTRRDVVAAP